MRRTATFTVDGEVLERFRIAVVERHGKLQGQLSSEAERALDAHADRLQEEQGGSGDG